MRGLIVLCCLCLAGTAAGAGPAPQGPITIRIAVTQYDRSRLHPTPQTSRFVLMCNPTGGTLPFADRVCRAIARHPVAMLDPPPPRSVKRERPADNVSTG